jgi:carbon-monoxide dehydrogenase small subunit
MADPTAAHHDGVAIDQTRLVALRVNGTTRTVDVPARRLLSDALRHDLRLTGTHVGCEHGVCGCCTVLLDGAPVRSCLMFTVSAEGHEITTVEGLSPGAGAADGHRRPGGAVGPDGDERQLHPIQRAFQDCHGLQCGFCTPGFVMAVAGLLADNPEPDRDEIVEGISGNLCRCTGYANIVAAVERAAALLRAGGDAPVSATTAPEEPSHDRADEALVMTPYAPAGAEVPGALDRRAASDDPHGAVPEADEPADDDRGPA